MKVIMTHWDINAVWTLQLNSWRKKRPFFSILPSLQLPSIFLSLRSSSAREVGNFLESVSQTVLSGTQRALKIRNFHIPSRVLVPLENLRLSSNWAHCWSSIPCYRTRGNGMRSGTGYKPHQLSIVNWEEWQFHGPQPLIYLPIVCRRSFPRE